MMLYLTGKREPVLCVRHVLVMLNLIVNWEPTSCV